MRQECIKQDFKLNRMRYTGKREGTTTSDEHLRKLINIGKLRPVLYNGEGSKPL